MKQETTKAEIKESLLWHNHHISVVLHEMKNWCVKKHSEKNRRYEFSDEE